MAEMERKIGTKLPSEFDSPESLNFYVNICQERGIHISKPLNMSRVLDKLCSKLIEPKLVEPTFLLNHPATMSPLAK